MKMNEIKSYSAIGGNGQVLVWDKNEIKSEVENTLTMDCFLNAFSLDQIGKSNFNANAKYSTSFGCGASFNPSDNFTVYSGRENTLNSGSSSFIANSISSNFFLAFSAISPLCFSTSSNNFSGPTGLNLPENSKSCTTPSAMNAAKTLLASNLNQKKKTIIIILHTLNTEKFIMSINKIC